jgi:hypothetical protein
LQPGQRAAHAQAIAGAGASHADVAVHDASVWIAWNQVDAQGDALMLRRSDDGGLHFGPPHVLANSTAAVGSPQLLQHDGHAYVAWNTAAGFRLLPAGDTP